MNHWQRHLREASGWLDLGMIVEAAECIEKIPPEDKMRPEVIGFRVGLYITAKKWEAGAVVAQRMVDLEPGNSAWWQSWALCVRHWQSPAEAEKILLRAARLFPEDALLFFNLGCLAAVQGRISYAHDLVRKSCAMNDDMRALAIDCEDLKPVWDSIAGSE